MEKEREIFRRKVVTITRGSIEQEKATKKCDETGNSGADYVELTCNTGCPKWETQWNFIHYSEPVNKTENNCKFSFVPDQMFIVTVCCGPGLVLRPLRREVASLISQSQRTLSKGSYFYTAVM
jgi:hypothetical protein